MSGGRRWRLLILKVIERGVAALEKTEAKALADAAGKAAKNSTEVTSTTFSNPEMIAQQKKMADALKASGL